MSSRPKLAASASPAGPSTMRIARAANKRAHLADHVLTAAAFALVLAIVCGIGVERRFGIDGDHPALVAQSLP